MIGAKNNMPHGGRSPFCYFRYLASPKAPTVGSAGNKKIVSSVRDKNNSHGDWREDIFYNRRNGKETEIKRKNSISGIIMLIMIISFRDKTEKKFCKILNKILYNVSA